MAAPRSGPAAPGTIGDRAFVAAQDFILGAKTHWTTQIFPALRAEYERRAAAAPKRPVTAEQVASLIGDTVLYRYYAWLERHLQRFKYSGRYGLQPYHDQRREALEAALEPATLPSGLLALEEGFDLPKYFANVDIHQHPGGIWSDEIAGYVYERGARTTTPLAGALHKDLHDRFTDLVAAAGTPRRILDMGCGFGKSTRPFFTRFRESEVVGIDIAAPCLKLAAKDAAEAQAGNVLYEQRDCSDTGLEDGGFDLVTSTMLIHEMPPPVIEKTFEEAFRLLAPGGRMAHLDFYHLPDPFLRFVHYTHGRRNNEPYMEPFCEMDLPAVLESKGFRNVEIRPFEEADGVLEKGYGNWRFPWTVITAER